MADRIAEILARNLKIAMEEANGGRGISQAQLSKLSGVAQTTISLMLRPEDRRNPLGKGGSSPTVERIAMIAQALHRKPWELLHPDPVLAKRALAMYAQIRREYAATERHTPDRAELDDIVRRLTTQK